MPKRWRRKLMSHKMPGVHFRATVFEPTFQKHAKQPCGGVQIHVLDRDAFPAVQSAVAVLMEIRSQNPARFQWRQPPVRVRNGETAVRHPGRLQRSCVSRSKPALRCGDDLAAAGRRRSTGSPAIASRICCTDKVPGTFLSCEEDVLMDRTNSRCDSWPATKMAIASWPRRLQGATEAELDARPAPGKWTAREIVHHLADSEMTSAVRLRLLVAEEHARFVRTTRSCSRARSTTIAPSPLQCWRSKPHAVQRRAARQAERGGWAKEGTHPEHDRYSVERWLEIYAAHAHNHADQITRARASVRDYDRGAAEFHFVDFHHRVAQRACCGRFSTPARLSSWWQAPARSPFPACSALTRSNGTPRISRTTCWAGLAGRFTAP